MAGLKEQFILNKNSLIMRAIMVEFRKKSTVLNRFEQPSYVLRLSASAVRSGRQISTFARHTVVLSDP